MSPSACFHISFLSLLNSTKCANGEVAGSTFEPSGTCPQKRHFNVPISFLFKKTKQNCSFMPGSSLWPDIQVQSRHLDPVGRTITSISCTRAYWKVVVSFLAQLCGHHSEQHAEGTAHAVRCFSPAHKLCQAVLICCHNGSSKLHKVIDKDRPCTWGEGERRNFTSINIISTQS